MFVLCLCVMYLCPVCVSSVVNFHRCEFLFVLFRILIMTCSFASASYYTRHTPMFITISPNRKCKSTNLACNKLFVRYVVEINKPYTEYECVYVCFWIAFYTSCVFLWKKVRWLTFLFYCNICVMFVTVSRSKFPLLFIGLFNDSSFKKTKKIPRGFRLGTIWRILIFHFVLIFKHNL